MNRTTTLLLCTLAMAALTLSGCTAGNTGKGAKGLGLGSSDEPPVLYLNITANGQTYRYSTADLGGGGGNSSSPSGSVSGSVTPGGNGTVKGNATSGNSTAQGNATAGNGSATATGTYGNASNNGTFPPKPGTPSGPAPFNVSVELGASRLPVNLPINWTLAWGDAARTQGGNTSANATATPGAVPQQMEEHGSSLPTRLHHTFTTAGDHQISFRLLGKATSAAPAGQALQVLKAAVHVTESVPTGMPSGTFLGNQTQVFSGSAPASVPGLCSTMDTFAWTLNRTMNGTASVVNRILITGESDGLGELNITLKAGNGTVVASGGSIDAKGPFPPGMYSIEVEACPSADFSYELTAVGQHFAK